MNLTPAEVVRVVYRGLGPVVRRDGYRLRRRGFEGDRRVRARSPHADRVDVVQLTVVDLDDRIVLDLSLGSAVPDHPAFPPSHDLVEAIADQAEVEGWVRRCVEVDPALAADLGLLE